MKKLWPVGVIVVLVGCIIFTYVQFVAGAGGADATEQKLAPDPIKTDNPLKPPPIDKLADPPQEIVKKPDPVKPVEKKTPEDAKAAATAAELFLKAFEAEKAGDPAAISLYQKVIDTDRASEVAVQAAAKLGRHYYVAKETAKATEYLTLALSGKLGEERNDLQRMLDEINSDLLSSPGLKEGVSYYTVVRGDSLSRIAAKYSIPYEMLIRLNNLKSTRIRENERLKVVQGPFDIVVEKSKFRLSVYSGDKHVKSYRVGLGKDNSTPEGTYTVESKLKNPDWFRPGRIVKYGDPENPLGSRWIGFSKSYGIHGTVVPETIGTAASEGCVRMLNADVEELSDMLIKGKSKVTVKP